MLPNKLSITFLIFVFLSACKTTDLTTDSANKKLPANYTADADSSTIKLAQWKELIFDQNLKTLVDSALVYNYDLRMALQRVEIARAGIKFTRGIRLPEIGVNLAAGQRKFGDYTMDGVGNYDTQFSTNISEKQQIPNPLPDYYGGIQASWEIDLWGKLKNKKRAAASRFISSQYGKDLIITNLIAEVSESYFALIALEHRLKILEENITLQQEALNIVTSQMEAAMSNQLAVEMLQAQLLSSKTIQAETRQQLIEAESRLNFLCGRFPQTIKRDTAFYSKSMVAAVNAGLPSSLIKNRADIRQAEAQLWAQNADVKAAKAAFYPALNINAAAGFQSFTASLLLESPASLAYSVFGGLTAPLLNRRRIKADLMAAKGEQRQAYLQYEKKVVNSFTEVYIALNNIKNTDEMFTLKKEEAGILKQSITTSSELFKAGRANYLEIIVAQKNALQSQLELINYYQRQNSSKIDLYRALGGGWQ